MAARAAGRLLACLSEDADAVDGEILPTRSHVQGYFRVRTTALTGPQAALHAVLVIQSAIADLRNVPLAGSDIARETAALRQVVVDLTTERTAGSSAPSSSPTCGGRATIAPATATSSPVDPFRREAAAARVT